MGNHVCQDKVTRENSSRLHLFPVDRRKLKEKKE